MESIDGAAHYAVVAKKRTELTRQMQLAGMTGCDSDSGRQGVTQLPLMTMLQDLTLCQGQAPCSAYAHESQMKLTFKAMNCCNGLQSGMSCRQEQAETAAELVAALLMHVCGHGKSSVDEACSTADKAQAEEAHLLVAELVSRRMVALLDMFMPHLSNATVRTAVNHLAVGMSGFKSEDMHMATDAASVLPLVQIFIKAVQPHCNKAFQAASTRTACQEQRLAPQTEAVCEVLMLAINTFESAVEVTLRYEVQGASEIYREHHSLTGLSTSLGCEYLMTPDLLLISQISSMLQSVLHMEVVLGMKIAEHKQQPSPMLQQLLLHAESMVKALHVFWLMHGQAAGNQTAAAGSEVAVMVPDLLSLLVLVKSTLKACSLSHEDHTLRVKNMLLLVVGPGTDMLNLLQIIWRLLHVRPGVSVIGPRVCEIFEVCLQQRQNWPKIFRFLMKGMNLPHNIAKQLEHFGGPDATHVLFQINMSQPITSSNEDRHSLMAHQARKSREIQRVIAELQAGRGALPEKEQTGLSEQARLRDAADLKVMLLEISKLMLKEAPEVMSMEDRKELEQFERQSKPAKHLWDRQEILPRPNVQAIDEGDNEPASLDEDTNLAMPTLSAQGQHSSSPHTAVQEADAVPSPRHDTNSCTNLGSNKNNQSGSTSPVVRTTSGSNTAMELEAKMAAIEQKIAAKKEAAQVAAKARKAAKERPATSSSTAPGKSMPTQPDSVSTTGHHESASKRSKLCKTSGTVYNSSMGILHNGNTSQGRQPAIRHNDQQVPVPEQQHTSSATTKLAVPDMGHAQADTTASSHGSATSSQPHAVRPNQATSNTASEGTQVAASTDGKQDEQISTGSSANQLPIFASQIAVSGSDEGAAREGHSIESNSASLAARLPAVRHKYAGQDAQNSQISQVHLDPTSWDAIFLPSSISSGTTAFNGVGSTLSGNIALQAAAKTPLPGQEPTQPRAGSQPNVRSLAADAMATTARRLDVMNSHAFMPSVLQDKTTAGTEVKLAMPVQSAHPDECLARESPALQTEQSVAFSASTHTLQPQPDQLRNDKVPKQLQADSLEALSFGSNDTATPMDIDTNGVLLKSNMQPHETSFGKPPTAAFGHLHHSSCPAGPCCDGFEASGDDIESVMLLGDNQNESHDQIGSDAMDIDDS